MKITLKYFFILSLFVFQAANHPVFAVKPIPNSVHKIHKVKKDDPPTKNKLARWSLILAAAGFVSLFIPYLNMASAYLMVGGIVCGVIALGQIKKTKEKGKGLAITSIILGGVFIITAIIALVVLLSLFR